MRTLSSLSFTGTNTERVSVKTTETELSFVKRILCILFAMADEPIAADKIVPDTNGHAKQAVQYALASKCKKNIVNLTVSAFQIYSKNCVKQNVAGFPKERHESGVIWVVIEALEQLGRKDLADQVEGYGIKKGQKKTNAVVFTDETEQVEAKQA